MLKKGRSVENAAETAASVDIYCRERIFKLIVALRVILGMENMAGVAVPFDFDRMVIF